MKRIDIISLFPEMLANIFSHGVISQGQKNKVLEIFYHNPRSFTLDKHHTVDDRPFGGGAGMVMLAEPLKKTFESIPKLEKTRFIYLSPQGTKLTAQKSKELAQYDQLIFLSGRYEGVDERFLNLYVQEELSIGDYVLSGGELPCAVAVDAVSRFYEGVLGNKESFETDTFSDDLLKYPQFTRPSEFEGLRVPEVLMGGNHKLIEEFRKNMSILKTHLKRPDLLLYRQEKDPAATGELDQAFEFLEGLSAEDKKSLGLLEFIDRT